MRGLYTGGIVPSTLFSFEGFFCIIQDSSRHLLEVWVHVLMICTAAQSMGWPVEWACFASTEVTESPMQMAWWCSFRRHARVLLVCPMYACGQPLHGTRYRYHTWSTLNRNWVLKPYKSWHRMLTGRKVVLLPKGLRRLLWLSNLNVWDGNRAIMLLAYAHQSPAAALLHHPIAVVPLCGSSGRLCCLAWTGSTLDAPRLLVLLLVCPHVVSSHTLLSLFAAIVGGLYLFRARWVYTVSYTGCASLVTCQR